MELEPYLRMFVDYGQTHWAAWLALANFHLIIHSNLTLISPLPNYGLYSSPGLTPLRCPGYNVAALVNELPPIQEEAKLHVRKHVIHERCADRPRTHVLAIPGGGTNTAASTKT